jgi:hypothetical protein
MPRLIIRFLKVTEKEEKIKTSARVATIPNDANRILIKVCGAAAGHAELTLRIRTEKTEVDDQTNPSREMIETVHEHQKLVECWQE